MKIPLEVVSRKAAFLRMLTCSALLIIFGTMQAQAMDMHRCMHHGMHNFKWWQSERLAKELKLTSNEKQALDTLYVNNRDTLIDLKSTLKKDRFKLHDMLEKDAVDENSVLAQNKIISEDRLKISDEHIKYILGIRRILGPERSHQLKARFHEMMGKRHGKEGHAPWDKEMK